MAAAILAIACLPVLVHAQSPQSNPSADQVASGDLLAIGIAGQAGISGNYTVDPAGDVTIGALAHQRRIHAAGLSFSDLAAAVQTNLRPWIGPAAVSVAMAQKAPVHVRVEGTVFQPGEYAIPRDSTVSTVLASAGDLLTNGSRSDIALSRGGKTYTLNLDRGGASQTVMEGDLITVRARTTNRITLIIPNRAPIPITFTPGLTLFRVLVNSGLTLGETDLSRTRLVRPDGSVTQVDLSQQTGDDPDASPLLEPGDQIQLGPSAAPADSAVSPGVPPVSSPPSVPGPPPAENGSLKVQGAVRSPGTQPVSPRTSLGEVLRLSGVFRNDADLSAVLIERPDPATPSVQLRVRSVNLEAIIGCLVIEAIGQACLSPALETSCAEREPLLAPNDVITVPARRGRR